MNFIDTNIDSVLLKLESLKPDTAPLWGQMSAQEMVEHLAVVLDLAIGKSSFPMMVSEDKISRAQDFISSEHPMPKNFKVNFAIKNENLKYQSIQGAIIGFSEAWKSFTDYYDDNPNQKNLHPNFGSLDYSQWMRLHSKHLTHHFEQFGI